MRNKPEIIVFAGPNGSGKSTIAKMSKVIEPYINADDIKRVNLCSDIEEERSAGLGGNTPDELDKYLESIIDKVEHG